MGESRSEDILENILGAENELVPPQSRIEILLQQLLEAMGSGSGGSGGGTATFIQLTRSGTDVSVDMTYQELLTALSSGGTTYVVMETPPVIDNGPTYVVVCHLDGYSEADSSVWFTAELGGKTYRIELISTLDQLDNEHYYMAGSYQEAGGGVMEVIFSIPTDDPFWEVSEPDLNTRYYPQIVCNRTLDELVDAVNRGMHLEYYFQIYDGEQEYPYLTAYEVGHVDTTYSVASYLAIFDDPWWINDSGLRIGMVGAISCGIDGSFHGDFSFYQIGS